MIRARLGISTSKDRDKIAGRTKDKKHKLKTDL